jgi:hypothetical protein
MISDFQIIKLQDKHHKASATYCFSNSKGEENYIAHVSQITTTDF